MTTSSKPTAPRQECECNFTTTHGNPGKRAVIHWHNDDTDTATVDKLADDLQRILPDGMVLTGVLAKEKGVE